jgi:hypothetical protein
VWFAVDEQFQGERTTAGTPVAPDFYASVERRALQGPRSDPSMIVETFCHYENGDALRFWLRQGFTDIGSAVDRVELRRLIRFAALPPATGPAS